MTLGDRVVVMSDGLVQQCDRPLTIYQRPVNRFVAGFLGTPPMNFLEGTLHREDGVLWFRFGPHRLSLTEQQAAQVASAPGDQVVLGVRPEHMRLRAPEDAPPGRTLPLRLEVVEPLGSDMDVYLSDEDGLRLVARVPAEQVAEQQRADVWFDLVQAHVFEPGQYGRNLTLEQETATV
jgi:multiple sugar transport system ATP-binding protein